MTNPVEQILEAAYEKHVKVGVSKRDIQRAVARELIRAAFMVLDSHLDAAELVNVAAESLKELAAGN